VVTAVVAALILQALAETAQTAAATALVLVVVLLLRVVAAARLGAPSPLVEKGPRATAVMIPTAAESAAADIRLAQAET
jgi:hypothetical protein